MAIGEVYYTNSTFLNVAHPISPIERVKKEGMFHDMIEAGALSHVWIADTRPSAEAVASFVKSTFTHTRNAQIAFSPEFTTCNICMKVSRGLVDTCPLLQLAGRRRHHEGHRVLLEDLGVEQGQEGGTRRPVQEQDRMKLVFFVKDDCEACKNAKEKIDFFLDKWGAADTVETEAINLDTEDGLVEAAMHGVADIPTIILEDEGERGGQVGEEGAALRRTQSQTRALASLPRAIAARTTHSAAGQARPAAKNWCALPGACYNPRSKSHDRLRGSGRADNHPEGG